jgi:hypothetical protein
MGKCFHFICDGCGKESDKSKHRYGTPPDWFEHWNALHSAAPEPCFSGLFCGDCFAKMLKAVKPEAA